MSCEEAILHLDFLKDFKTPDQVQALDMAINVLTCIENIKNQICEEKEFAYADFDRYKVECLGIDCEDVSDNFIQDFYHLGMERCIDIINKYLLFDNEKGVFYVRKG